MSGHMLWLEVLTLNCWDILMTYIWCGYDIVEMGKLDIAACPVQLMDI